MRIAYLSFDAGVPVFGTGGSSVHVRNTVESLRHIGHEVRIFSTAVGEVPVQGHSLQGLVQAVSLEGLAGELAQLLAGEAALPDHLAKEWRTLLMAEHAPRRLGQDLADFGADLIYERYSLFGYAGAELARQLRIPLLLEVNSPLRDEQLKYRRLVLQQTAREIEQKIFLTADLILAVSTPLAEYAQQLGVKPEHVTVLPNAVDPELFHPSVPAESVRSRYGLDGKSVVGFVGSLKPWHDVDTLVAATQLLVDRDEQVHLLVVGDGPRRATGGEHVTYTGAVEHEEVPSFLSAMDIVVVPYPTHGETYFSPLKLFEAMAMAKPVVGARVGQVGELIIDNSTGVFYEPGNPHDLAGKLEQTLRREDRGAALGVAAREWVVANHTWDQNARRIVALAKAVSPMVAAP